MLSNTSKTKNKTADNAQISNAMISNDISEIMNATSGICERKSYHCYYTWSQYYYMQLGDVDSNYMHFTSSNNTIAFAIVTIITIAIL